MGIEIETAECIDARARNRGLLRLLVLGRREARIALLLYALAHNAMRSVALEQAAAEAPA